MLSRDFVHALVSVGFAPRLLLSQQTVNPARRRPVDVGIEPQPTLFVLSRSTPEELVTTTTKPTISQQIVGFISV
jgi:hypothetical protein